MKVAILHDRMPDTGGDPDHLDGRVQTDAVRSALLDLGHQAEALSFSLDVAGFVETLQRFAPDLVFNLLDSVEGCGRLIHLAPSVLDVLNMPYTGAGADALFITSHKVLAKRLLATAGIPTPRSLSPEEARHRTAPLEGPYIIKSLWEHASVGMGNDAVVSDGDPQGLYREMVRRREMLGGACFAERYVDGREFNISLLAEAAGPRILPPAEIRFEGYPPGKPRILDYRAKWVPDSFEYRHTRRSFALPENEALLFDRLADMAAQCWRLFSLKGYARVDFRVDRDNRPWVLEINANPCLSPDAGFAAAARRAGLTLTDVVAHILSDAAPEAA